MAKLRPDQLHQSLTKQLAPVYLVSGDEHLFVQEAADAIRQAARKAGFLERERYYTDSGFDWEQLLSSVNSLSLFADKKIIELTLHNGKPGDKGSKALLSFCDHPPEDTLLLISTGKLESASTRSKWYKTLEQTGHVVQIWPITPQQLPRWIDQRLNQAGLSASPEAIDLIAARVEGNLLAAAQEIEKLKLLTTEANISTELAASAVADSARYDVFGLVDKALVGDSRGAVKSLHGLKGEGTDATVVLWALAREIRTLYQLQEMINEGGDFDRLARSVNVWDKRKPMVRSALHRIKANQLQLLLRKAGAIDKAIKGLREADPWDELTDLILNLSGNFSLSGKSQKLALS